MSAPMWLRPFDLTVALQAACQLRSSAPQGLILDARSAAARVPRQQVTFNVTSFKAHLAANHD